ncbi:hypothetical protein COOONC_06391 [Cooperia oncophora]
MPYLHSNGGVVLGVQSGPQLLNWNGTQDFPVTLVTKQEVLYPLMHLINSRQKKRSRGMDQSQT